MSYILRSRGDNSFYTGKTFRCQGEIFGVINDYKDAKRYRSEKVAKKVCLRLNAICENAFEVVEEVK